LACGRGGPSSPGGEPVIGCPGSAWPEGRLAYLAPKPSGSPSPADVQLEAFRPTGISGDGRVVIGAVRETDYSRPVPASFTWDDGVTLLPAPEGTPSPEGYARRSSCDGSVILVHEESGDVYRTEGGHAQRIFTNAQLFTLSVSPNGTTLLDGARDQAPGPRLWTSETGTVYLPELHGTELYLAAPGGALIGSDFEALFRYDRTSGVRQPIGTAPVMGPTSIALSASGEAWIESADVHGDSFLLRRPGRQPKSITCPGLCMPLDVSSTGAVVLLDIALDLENFSLSTWVWTESTGFVELTHFLNAFGIGFGPPRLLAAGLSDDGRAFAGQAWGPLDPSAGFRFFYAVLPETAYQ